jgi:hypothetical protein
MMSDAQLTCAVAEALGESVRVVHNFGFQLVEDRPDDLEPENVRPAVECPFCRRVVPYPGRLENGEWPLAECDRCDLLFEISEHDLFAAAV